MTDKPRIDLEWCKQKIHGFAEMLRVAQENKQLIKTPMKDITDLKLIGDGK